mmetsp:Transcript_7018/g.43081  ORF Transcript_7018/g.43081 Transcript_7018/m.43081 type:complete len:82 (-) Transcript_7018:507-752(-)
MDRQVDDTVGCERGVVESCGCVELLDVERCESIAIRASRSGASDLLSAMPQEMALVESKAHLYFVSSHEAVVLVAGYTAIC